MLKYPIFINATYDDLRAEREQVLKAVLEMGHIPVGMEMFSAADEEQWKLIARQIDESDYYVVIVAHRYGSVVDGISFTEKEYDYAVQHGVPVLGFILEDAAPWPGDRRDTDTIKPASLARFKEKVRRKPVGFWRSADDLHAKMSIALMKAFTTTPRTGWARASGVPGPEVTNELSRLSAENADLRKALNLSSQKAQEELAHKQQDTIETLKRNTRSVPLRLKASKPDWDSTHSRTLFDIFSLMAPALSPESTEQELGKLIAIHTADKMDDLDLSQSWLVPSNFMATFLTDLAVLDLVQPSPKRHSVTDKARYWTLTEQGHQVIRTARLERLKRGTGGIAKKLIEEKPSEE